MAPIDDDNFDSDGIGDEEALLNDLNLNRDIGSGSGDTKSLPKKVELDIDDMILDEDEEEEEEPEEEAGPEEEPQPSEVVEKKEEKAPESKPKISKVKLLILVSIVLLPLLFIGGGVYYLLKPAAKTEAELQPPPSPEIKLHSFVVNYPQTEDGHLLKVVFIVTFSNSDVKTEFENRLVFMRDIIYRFMQGQGPPADEKIDEMKGKIVKDLINLIDKQLKRGRLKDIKIAAFKLV